MIFDSLLLSVFERMVVKVSLNDAEFDQTASK